MVEIDLQLDCDVSPEKLAVLVTLLQEFLPDASIPNIDHLGGIRVVPDSNKNATVNDLLRMGSDPGSYIARDHSNACAIPVIMNTSLHCYIILCESFVQKINPQTPYDAQIVLTLLEEMLHVRVYSTLWEQKGNLYPPSDLSCTADLTKICTSFRDEYIVNRWKYAYFVSQAEKTVRCNLFPRPIFP